ncbi:MAG: hypothetical protein KAS17_09300 [Victivallaceae bacterium]|nr:hypothetical protein [Victivallaceae bacterium]
MSTKRERLLEWIRNGDAEQMPVLMGLGGKEIASSYLRKPLNETTWADAIKTADETGTHNAACIGMPLPFKAIDFLDGYKMETKTEKTADGGTMTRTHFTTPEKVITEVRENSPTYGQFYREHFVKDENDWPAFANFIRRSTTAIVENPAIRKKIDEDTKTFLEQVKGEFPTHIHIFCSAVELMNCFYMDQTSAIYAVYEKQELFEELMENHWQMTQVWLEIAANNNIDLYSYAINGFEWLSPDLYERYMIPQAKRINDFVHSQGKLAWLHTCGKLKNIAKMNAYQQMGIDILESLSLPPTGDIDNLAETRADIGIDIVTRGGINCESFYEKTPDMVRKQAKHVMESVEGYKHMLGDTNTPYPPYPWENIQAMIDVVRDRGRLYE